MTTIRWLLTGSESSDSPAPTIEVKGSLGGGGSSLLAIVALIVAVLALLAGGFPLVSGKGESEGRPLT